MDNTNNENQAEENPAVVSPDQTTMFGGENIASGEDVTRMEISHDDGADISHSEEPIYNLGAVPAEEKHDDEVPNSTKIKVVAALAIVGVAGYIAYWVQEPVQLKADLLNGYSDSSTAGTSSSADTTSTASSTENKNVDVSLFGFEPAVMKINKGTTVIWTNTSTEDQTLIGSSEEGQSFTSPVMTTGSTFSYKFDQDSTFTYYSTYNPALKATLTVGTGGAAAATTTATEEATSTIPTDSITDSSAAVDTNVAALFGSADSTTTSTPEFTNSDSLFGSAATETTTTTTTTSNTTPSAEELKGAAPSGLTKTGPVEDLYVVVLLGIAWFNRKKLAKVFNK